MPNDNIKIVMMKPEDIKPHKNNPRRHEVTVRKLVELIPRVGFNVPIVVDKNNVIVKGHARWKASVKLNLETVPCIISDADDDTNALDRITDNRVSEFSEWLPDNLEYELDAMIENYEVLEFPKKEFDDYAEENVIIDRYNSGEIDLDKYKTFVEVEAEKSAKVGNITERNISNANERVKDVFTERMSLKVICPDCGEAIYMKEKDFRNYNLR